MFDSINGLAKWWIDGLVDLVLALLDRVSGGRRFVLAADGTRWRVLGSNRRQIGTVEIDGAQVRFEPASIADKLKGARVELEVPSSWVFRRALEPVAAQSVPYLDAFVRHHIERVTPWRQQDTYFGVVTKPHPGDAKRLDIELGVVPRHLVMALVETVRRLGPNRLTLAGVGGDSPFTIMLSAGDPRRRIRVGRVVGAMLGTAVLVLVGIVSAASWMQTMMEGEIAELDDLIASRKQFLVTAAERAKPKDDPAEGMRRARADDPYAIQLLEALSEALPDQAYITDLRMELRKSADQANAGASGLPGAPADQIRIIGIAKDVSELIPALEASPKLRDVAFFAPTTRLPTGGGDRFSIELHIETPPKLAEAK